MSAQVIVFAVAMLAIAAFWRVALKLLLAAGIILVALGAAQLMELLHLVAHG
jgi:hypothetical protein